MLVSKCASVFISSPYPCQDKVFLQEPATCAYPEPDQSSPRFPILFLEATL